MLWLTLELTVFLFANIKMTLLTHQVQIYSSFCRTKIFILSPILMFSPNSGSGAEDHCLVLLGWHIIPFCCREWISSLCPEWTGQLSFPSLYPISQILLNLESLCLMLLRFNSSPGCMVFLRKYLLYAELLSSILFSVLLPYSLL